MFAGTYEAWGAVLTQGKLFSYPQESRSRWSCGTTWNLIQSCCSAHIHQSKSHGQARPQWQEWGDVRGENCRVTWQWSRVPVIVPEGSESIGNYGLISVVCPSLQLGVPTLCTTTCSDNRSCCPLLWSRQALCKAYHLIMWYVSQWSWDTGMV
jgi:hypothetical protein